MSNIPIWLAGTLVTHRRRRILQDVVSAQPIENQFPSFGLCMLCGSDFQDADDAQQQKWCEWSEEPGNTLLLIPPFAAEKTSIPCEWEIRRYSVVNTKQDIPLLRLLAPEVCYELLGKLQVATQIGGAWDNFSINTAYYRKHPHSGIFAITCLPLWSLAVLNQERELQKWLEQLHGFTSKLATTKAVKENSFAPKLEHFAVMLYLISQKFADQATAIQALEKSTIFSIDGKIAQTCLAELQSQGLITGVQLTARGEDVIRFSPYLAYAEVLETSAR